jgi:Cyclic nucleotide-binding domain
VLWSYLDIVEASKSADEVFVGLTRDRDPAVAALAISALATTDPTAAEGLAAELRARADAGSPLVEDALLSVTRGSRADTIVIMAELLAVDMFAELDLDTLAHIARQSALVTYRAGDQICRFGESSESMFVLVRGETQAWAQGERGRIIFRREKPGVVFGEIGIITGSPRTASVEVVTASAEVVAIPRKVIDDLLNRDLHATRAVLNVVSSYLLSAPPAPVPTPLPTVVEAHAAAAQ